MPKAQQKILPEHLLFDVSYMERMLTQKKNAIYNLCKDKLIDYHKIGRLLYFKKEDIDAFLERTKIKNRFLLLLASHNLDWLYN